MLKIILFVFFIVNYTLALSNFIEKGQRPKLFELTDNDIAIFRVTLPKEEYSLFKSKANIGNDINNKFNILKDLYLRIKGYVEFLAHFQYTKVYPGYNFTEILPELNIDDEGYAHINVDEIMTSLNITKEGLLALDFSDESVQGTIHDRAYSLLNKRNPNFNITRINNVLDSLIPDEKYRTNNNNNNNNSNSDDDEIFKTKNGTLVVELNGKEKQFNKMTFSIGGYSGRRYGKLGYNFKIRGKDELYGRTQFRLRSDAREPTFIRSKLVCDIQNRLGLPSISANYGLLYINDEFMGLYILMDIYKQSWIEYEYGEKETKTLYQCKTLKNYLTSDFSSVNCVNKNDKVTDYSEWIEFLKTLDQAQSVYDLEDVFDVELFLKQMALEFLFGSWDHFLNYGHNYYLYKPVNDKWKYLSYDFDGEFGQDIELAFIGMYILDVPELMHIKSTDYPHYSFENFAKKNHLLEILILNDPTHFNEILKDIVSKVFNPATLYPHIDEIKSFIKPYVELDKTPNKDGILPGRLNKKIKDYSMAQWDANTEFTSIESTANFRSFGIKYWILKKYRYICKSLNMECDPVYMDDNYDYPIDKNVQFTIFDTQKTITTSTTSTTTITYTTTQNIYEATNTIQTYNCLAETIGFSCCSSDNKVIYYQDEFGDWGFDFETNDWCGITPYVEPKKECWSEKLGYNCCVGCDIIEIDDDGKWGIENNEWCGIETICEIN